MLKLLTTDEFDQWFDHLKDRRARLRITACLRRFAQGNLGDAKSLGNGLSELRIDYGEGYRIYYARHGERVYILLAGGDKSAQSRDINRARDLLKEVRKGRDDER